MTYIHLLYICYHHITSQVQAALERVRAGADVMPKAQLASVLSKELGGNWETRVASFDWEPAAAASIGQVGGEAFKESEPQL
jgi:aarF domain-containing kinase